MGCAVRVLVQPRAQAQRHPLCVTAAAPQTGLENMGAVTLNPELQGLPHVCQTEFHRG